MRVLQALLCLFLTLPAWAAPKAEDFARAGRKAEKAGDSFRAFLLYAQAANLDPKNMEYRIRKAMLQPLMSLSQSPLKTPEISNPEIEGTVTGFEADEGRVALPPVKLRPSEARHSYDLRLDPRATFERVLRDYGITAIFESDYQGPPSFRFRISDADWHEALPALEIAGNSFLVPINERTALVVRDTVQKRTEKQPVMAVAVPIPSRISVQEATELATAVQQTLEIKRMTVDSQKRVIFIRDNVMKAMVARDLLGQLTQLRAQVSVEFEILSVASNSTLAWGMRLQNSFPIVNFGTKLRNTPSIPEAFTRFAVFGGGSTFLGLGVANAELFGSLARSSASTLLRGELLALDSQPSTLHVGDRYPIQTGAYVQDPSFGGAANAIPPPMSYEDLGLSLKVTPSVHSMEEVSLELEADFKVLGSASLNGVPVINNRKFQGKVRLREGEWAVLAGLVSLTDTESSSGFPLLSKIPLIGRLFRENLRVKELSQVMLVIKPHLTSLPPSEYLTRQVWLGSETRPLSMY